MQLASRHGLALFFLAVIFLVFLQIPMAFPVPTGAPESLLIQGKQSLDAKDYDKAVIQLTGALAEVPVLADYVLLWRAQAHNAKGEPEKALSDLASLTKDHPDSPLLRRALRREIEIRARLADSLLLQALERFVRDYPSETDMKFSLAMHLKKNNRDKEARKLLKEIYLTASPLSRSALAELPPSQITAEDLLKRGRNLNNAWQFEEAEATFREALKKEPGLLREQILEGLGYSLFRQKRYRESAEVFRKVKANYWLARSLLRAGDIDQFESLLPQFTKSTDPRFGQVILDYGTRKRRDGDLDAALLVYDTVMSRYPSMREDVLWAKAWAHYLSGNYESTLGLLTELSEKSGESRYRYWKEQTLGLLRGEEAVPQVARTRPEHRDFYGYLRAMETERGIRSLQGSTRRISSVPPPSERVDLLMRLGLTQEAAAELVHLSRKNGDPQTLRTLSVYLNKLEDFRTSLALAAKLPYSEDLHELLYPLAYWPEVEKAARQAGVDSLLILAVMREESRFAADARSIAGALGLMQLMPATAKRLSASADVTIRDAEDLLNQRTNILLGSRYLKSLMSSFNSLPLALAAYNAGEHNVKEWLRKGGYRSPVEFIEDIPFSETRTYVKKVMSTYFEYLQAAGDHDLARVRTQMGTL